MQAKSYANTKSLVIPYLVFGLLDLQALYLRTFAVLARCTAVSLLFCACRPAHITRFVMALIFDAFNREAWMRAHA